MYSYQIVSELADAVCGRGFLPVLEARGVDLDQANNDNLARLLCPVT